MINENELEHLVLSCIQQPDECEWFEFKHNFHSPEEIGELISALSNSACLLGKPYGYLFFGIDDATHHIVGTTFKPKQKKIKREELENWLVNKLSPKIDFRTYSILIDELPVVIYVVPAAIGTPTMFNKNAHIRINSAVRNLNEFPEKARKIYNSQFIVDWSATVLPDATLEDLDTQAIQEARVRYAQKNPRLQNEILKWDDLTFLNKAKLLIKGKVTNTAILLLGKSESEHYLYPAVGKISWILNDDAGQRRDYEHFGVPFLLTSSQVYGKIRNLKYRYMKSDSMFPEEVDQYDSYVIREALNNCIAHQDYTLGARISVIEREDGLLSFSNEGSFIPESIEQVITSEAPETKYRNRLLVDAMVNLNMIDTIGSGIRKMFEIQASRYFPLPDYDIRDEKVMVTITGKVLDVEYAKKLASMPDLSLPDIILLDKVQKKQLLSKDQVNTLRKKALVEGRFPNIVFSSEIAQHTDQKAEYVELRGLNDRYYEELIVAYIQKFGVVKRPAISGFLEGKLPSILSSEQKENKIRNLLQSMKRKGLIAVSGKSWVLPKPD